MTPEEALAIVREQGVVLEAARGSRPSLAELIAGEPIRGSWWSHPKGREIFAITRAVRESDEVLVCRLVEGKITYIHRRLWPALVRAAERFPPERLSRLREVHTSAGRHETEEVPFPQWVPAGIREAARGMSEESAAAELAVATQGRPPPPERR